MAIFFFPGDTLLICFIVIFAAQSAVCSRHDIYVDRTVREPSVPFSSVCMPHGKHVGIRHRVRQKSKMDWVCRSAKIIRIYCFSRLSTRVRDKCEIRAHCVGGGKRNLETKMGYFTTRQNLIATPDCANKTLSTGYDSRHYVCRLLLPPSSIECVIT